MCAREVLQFRESSDPEVSGSRVGVETSRKCRAEAAVDQAKSWLCHGVPVEAVAKRTAGLGGGEVKQSSGNETARFLNWMGASCGVEDLMDLL